MLYPDVVNSGTSAHGYFRYRIGNIGAFLHRNLLFHNSGLAARFRNDEAARMTCGYRLRGNKQDMHRHLDRCVTRDDHYRPIVQECRI